MVTYTVHTAGDIVGISHTEGFIQAFGFSSIRIKQKATKIFIWDLKQYFGSGFWFIMILQFYNLGFCPILMSSPACLSKVQTHCSTNQMCSSCSSPIGHVEETECLPELSIWRIHKRISIPENETLRKHIFCLLVIPHLFIQDNFLSVGSRHDLVGAAQQSIIHLSKCYLLQSLFLHSCMEHGQCDHARFKTTWIINWCFKINIESSIE